VSRSRASLKNCGNIGRSGLCSAPLNIETLTKKESTELVTIHYKDHRSINWRANILHVKRKSHVSNMLMMTATKPTKPMEKLTYPSEILALSS
jgi:hypothetical protein